MKVKLLAVWPSGCQYHALFRPASMLILLKNLTIEELSLFNCLFYNSTLMISVQTTNFFSLWCYKLFSYYKVVCIGIIRSSFSGKIARMKNDWGHGCRHNIAPSMPLGAK